MPRVFFTYVWGPPGDPCWPLTFGNKVARTIAKRVLSEGDFVFTVGTRKAPTLPKNMGRVLGVYRVSSHEVNTRDYVGQIGTSEVSGRAADEFPYALHPIAVWQVVAQNSEISALVGPLRSRDHLQARTTVVELGFEPAARLLALERRPVTLAEPQTLLGRGLVAEKNSKLAPKHEGEFHGQFGVHTIWFVYVLALKDRQGRDRAFKIGYAHDPAARLETFRTHAASEVTDFTWSLAHKQPTSSEDEARRIEQALLMLFAKHKLPSNGEIISGPSYSDIMSRLATVLRSN